MSLPSKHKQINRKTNEQNRLSDLLPRSGAEIPSVPGFSGAPSPMASREQDGQRLPHKWGQTWSRRLRTFCGESRTPLQGEGRSWQVSKRGGKGEVFCLFVFAFNESWGVKWERRPSWEVLGGFMCPGLRELLPGPQGAWLSSGFEVWPTLLGNYTETLRFNHPREFGLEHSLLVQTELRKSRAGLGQTTDSPPSCHWRVRHTCFS